MKKYVVFWHAGMCGTDCNSGVVEFDNETQAIDAFYSEADDWFWQFNEEEDFKDIEPEIDIWAEEYNPEKHDGAI